ncbi:hypothetical protein [Bacillus sp. EB01]|uniref:hypothetical protein n=1 Tax=Bacillus sp. EB01 TaxID=1347086 RepID=UPI0005C562F0|nr:hypothetical protein [Bacillus sp. EB01]
MAKKIRLTGEFYEDAKRTLKTLKRAFSKVDTISSIERDFVNDFYEKNWGPEKVEFIDKVALTDYRYIGKIDFTEPENPAVIKIAEGFINQIDDLRYELDQKFKD